ncbi:hypothetical protein EJ02DRAFT_357979 [Clathrospora elynae]|uniref:Uncharacterized protein n=1 Tax=Clathrospora elynae TaxID=706981 RepID=A0A6A5SAY0_9PLEO|nr:hypothetical protein EJ02DRAFT_357979 [Clathrospora elynae]
MKEEDILARQSRPQHHSTWIPKARDWRYATGVFQHHDFEDAPKHRSAWDTMDYDYQVGGTRGSKDGNRSRSGSGSGGGSNAGIDGSTAALGSPASAKPEITTHTSRTVVHVEVVQRKARCTPRNTWMSVTRYRSDAQAIEGSDPGSDPGSGAISLTVRLRFSGKLIVEDASHPPVTPRSLKHTKPPVTPQSAKKPRDLNTPATARTAMTRNTPHILDSIESIHRYPLFQRAWVDETHDFNIKAVRSTLRQPDAKVEELGHNYHWYTEAVPIDALLPPGVPLSAKEVIAYYPHHVRWKGMMVRLTNNNYRGADIIGMQTFFRGPPHNIPVSQMNNFQRDTVKAALPGFKTSAYKGKHDRNLHTNDFTLGKVIEDKRSGLTLPTFDHLLRGLKHLPTGLDARGLTQCLGWYLNVRDSFTPKLNLNVLHTQALIRALRLPLKPFGPQNLNCNALKEWREKGKFEELKVHYKQPELETPSKKAGQRRTQMHMNLDHHDVKLDLALPLRHIFTFPFLALHGVVVEALRLGIQKAKNRQAERKGAEEKDRLQAKWPVRQSGHFERSPEKAAEEVIETVEEPKEKKKEPYRIPKRPCPTQELLPASKKLAKIPPANGQGAPCISSELCADRQSSHLSRAWDTPAPSSAYMQPHKVYDEAYDRRDH